MRNLVLRNVSTVKEYFSLPKKEREYYGLYKIPFALPSELFIPSDEGWTTFYTKIKQEYPFQHFIRNWLFTLSNPIIFFLYKVVLWPFRDFKWSLKLFFNPMFPRWRATCPRYRYIDGVELIKRSNFAILLDFYHEEVVDGPVNWHADEKHETFLVKLTEYVKWIQNDSKEIDQKLDQELDEVFKNRKSIKKFDYNIVYGKYNKLEEEKKAKETEILKWIIDNREFFWT